MASLYSKVRGMESGCGTRPSHVRLTSRFCWMSSALQKEDVLQDHASALASTEGWMPSGNRPFPKSPSVESGMLVHMQDILVGLSHHTSITSVSAPSCPAGRVSNVGPGGHQGHCCRGDWLAWWECHLCREEGGPRDVR